MGNLTPKALDIFERVYFKYGKGTKENDNMSWMQAWIDVRHKCST